MRKMVKKSTGQELNIVEHIITRNFWEFYITDDEHSSDIVRALVMGEFTEIGDISRKEISPSVISRTKNLTNTAPAPGWEWSE